jgi:hypothetical protein
MTDKYWQKNVESKCEIKMGPFYLTKTKMRRFPVFPDVAPFLNILFELRTVYYSRLPIFILIRFWL